MPERCVACGKPIVAVRPTFPRITLARVWTHCSWWANRTHRAIPEERYRRG